MTKTNTRLALLCMLPLLFLACSGTEPPAPAGAPDDGVDASSNIDESRIEPDEAARELDRRIGDRISGAGSLDDVFVEAECFDGDDFRSVVLHGDGYAIWDGHVQFELGDADMREILGALSEVEFTTFKPLYGRSAMRIICRVEVRIGEVSKLVAQRQRGEQNPTLKKLANDIFDVCRPRAESGLAVTDLIDGLVKIAGGSLSPRALGLTVHRKPERTTPMPGEDPGWLMRLADGQGETQVYESGKLGDAWELEFDDSELEQLAGVLIDQGLIDLPENLYAPQYTDVIVRVLRYETRVQARQFAGMNPQTHGPRQVRFDRIFEALHELHQRTASDGTPSDS